MMQPMLAQLEFTDFLIIAGIVLLLAGRRVFASRRPDNSARLERKIDALLKHHGVALPPGALTPSGRTISAGVQDLARARQKIEAIKLHREENPGLGLAEAKADVDDFLASAR